MDSFTGINDLRINQDPETFYMRFKITAHGHTISVESEYDMEVQWHEILDDIVKALESSYGYSFDLPNDLGIYYKGKEDS
jgi:hypothetical protein